MAAFIRVYKKNIIAFVIAFVISVCIVLYESMYIEADRSGILRMVCDGTFVSGVIFIGFGLMTMISKAGGFNGIAYIGHVLVTKFSPSRKKQEAKKEYLDFVRERNERDTDTKYILFTGVIYFAISIIVLIFV